MDQNLPSTGEQLQREIDRCVAAGGGVVDVPTVVFTDRPIRVPSNVWLRGPVTRRFPPDMYAWLAAKYPWSGYGYDIYPFPRCRDVDPVIADFLRARSQTPVQEFYERERTRRPRYDAVR